MCLEIENSSTENGAHAQQWTCNPQARGMLWIKAYDGNWHITNYGSGNVLEVEDSSTRNGARVQQWDKSDTGGIVKCCGLTRQPNGRSIKQAACGSGRTRSAAGTPHSRKGRRTGADLPCP
ncbi:RICIN domain-containing protein [Streptomyces sp. NPDC029216]|uniref:RICIN domain-containing protein n=1 Tax=Streptomyces sp. NPDC029216 TaxID=3154701 RepID=UPI0033E023E0